MLYFEIIVIIIFVGLRSVSGNKVDVAFVIDSSGSIAWHGSQNWELVLNFTQNIVSKLPVSQDKTQIAVVIYSDEASVAFCLDDYNTAQSVSNKIYELLQFYQGGSTNTKGALRLLIDGIFTDDCGDRHDAPNIGIIITDGSSNSGPEQTIAEAERAKRRNITLIAVGISNRVDIREIRGIASQPHEWNYFTASDFDQLGGLVDGILASINSIVEEIDECISQPCHSDGVCLDRVGAYECNCTGTGFEGDICNIGIDECFSQPCQNDGVCLDDVGSYECNCSGTGFEGDICSLEIDECISQPCHNDGVCLDGVGSYECNCTGTGFEGDICSIGIDECISQPCHNDGVCIDGVGSYECNCTGTGFEGDVCNIEIDECHSQPCHNDGVCLDGVGSYECSCTGTGFEGDVCNIEIDECHSQPCHNNGVCLDNVGAYTCNCTGTGYEGDVCNRGQPSSAVNFSINTIENAGVTMRCGLEGTRHSISWFMNGKAPRDSVIGHNSNTLVIPRVSSNDFGIFTCINDGFTKPNRETYYLKDLGASSNATSKFFALMNDAIQIKCPLCTMIPQIKCKWTRSDNKPVRNGVITGDDFTVAITNVQREDFGEYICTATYLAHNSDTWMSIYLTERQIQGNPTNVIIGCSIFGIIVLIGAVILIYRFIKRRRKHRPRKTEDLADRRWSQRPFQSGRPEYCSSEIYCDPTDIAPNAAYSAGYEINLDCDEYYEPHSDEQQHPPKLPPRHLSDHRRNATRKPEFSLNNNEEEMNESNEENISATYTVLHERNGSRCVNITDTYCKKIQGLVKPRQAETGHIECIYDNNTGYPLQLVSNETLENCDVIFDQCNRLLAHREYQRLQRCKINNDLDEANFNNMKDTEI